MPDVSFDSLLVVAAVAVLAPLALGYAPRLRVPAVVVEIVGGHAPSRGHSHLDDAGIGRHVR